MKRGKERRRGEEEAVRLAVDQATTKVRAPRASFFCFFIPLSHFLFFSFLFFVFYDSCM